MTVYTAPERCWQEQRAAKKDAATQWSENRRAFERAPCLASERDRDRDRDDANAR